MRNIGKGDEQPKFSHIASDCVIWYNNCLIIFSEAQQMHSKSQQFDSI